MVKKRKFRSIWGILLSICLVVTLLPLGEIQSNAQTTILHSGKSGDLYWSIDSEGLLSITGVGDYDESVLINGCYRPEWLYYFEDIKKAKVSVNSINSTSGMFLGCYCLTEINFDNFDTSNVTNMCQMFEGCQSLKSLDLSSFNTSKVTDMSGMFAFCESLTELNMSNFNTSNVTTMINMFYECKNLIELDLSSFDTSNVTEMWQMFYACVNLKNLKLSKFNTSNVTEMGYMFSYCYSLSELDLSNFNTSNVTDMSHMFCACGDLIELDLSSFNTSNVTDMCEMFYACFNLKNLKVSKFNTSNVRNMRKMFAYCWSLSELDLTNFDTSNVIVMQDMFYECRKLTELDLSNFNTSNVENMENLLEGCYSLNYIKTPKFVRCSALLPIDENAWRDPFCMVYTELPQEKEESIELRKPGHSVTVSEIIEPTCTEYGYTVYKCSVCGEILYTDDYVEPSHKYEIIEKVEPKCTEQGYTVYKCSVCEETHIDDYVTALRHNIVNGQCSVCGKNEDECIESPHPYENNCDQTWEIYRKGAKEITITFAQDTELEEEYDYIYIYDKNNNLIGEYTGKELASKTITVKGDLVKLTLQSDDSTTEYGFSISKIDVRYNDITSDDFIIEGTTLVEYVGDDTEVIIPNGITTIDGSAFSNSLEVEKLVIPDSVTTIKGECCWEVKSIIIGKGLCNLVDSESDEMLEDCFNMCFELKSIIVDEQNNNFSSIDGVLFDKEKKTLIHFPKKKTDISYSIPDTVTRIASHAFDMTELYSVDIPNGVVEIGHGAFQQCNNLTNVNIPDSVTALGHSTFYDCENLKNVTIGKNVSDLVYHNTFQDCYKLEKINISTENKYYTAVDSVVFNKDKSKLILYPLGNKNTNYIIPDTVSTIGNYAFTGCQYLETVTIKHNILLIAETAFWNCNQLTICGYTNSYVESYAKTNNIKFKSLGTNSNITNNKPVVKKPVVKPVKIKQSMSVKAKTKKVKLKKVKKKKQIVSKAIVLKNAKGTVSYKKIKKGSSSKLTINKKTGKITVKKGTKKGTYKIKVKVTAKGNSKYLSASKTITVKIKVK